MKPFPSQSFQGRLDSIGESAIKMLDSAFECVRTGAMDSKTSQEITKTFTQAIEGQAVEIWNDGFEAAMKAEQGRFSELFNWNWATKSAAFSRAHWNQVGWEIEQGDYYTTECNDLALWKITCVDNEDEITTEQIFDYAGQPIAEPIPTTMFRHAWDKLQCAGHRLHVPHSFLKVSQ